MRDRCIDGVKSKEGFERNPKKKKERGVSFYDGSGF